MSCRVLKRGVEWFILNDLAERCKDLDKPKLIGEYIPTKKNKLVKDHYQSLGFVEDEGKWVLELKDFKALDNNISKA